VIPGFDWLASALLLVAGVLSALHVLVWKRDPRAALGWIGLCLLFPLAGVPMYWLLGVNRLRTMGRRLDPRRGTGGGSTGLRDGDPALPESLSGLVRIANSLARRPLVTGNRITPLFDGEQAFPEMLAAIDGARSTVRLCTYIFDTDATGRRFVDALAGAHGRGVDVRVLIDGIGEKYSWPRASRVLRQSGVPVMRFLPPSVLRPNLHMNLRNHRKLLVVDGALGFTGGMNLGGRHLAAATDNPRRVVDIHFRVEGPVVAQLEQAFHEDWSFTLRAADPPPPPVALEPAGSAVCRAISDGPNEDFEKLTWLLHGALGTARRRVRIMTPYFVPDRPFIAALIGASLRGVRVELLLPGRNNLPIVHWATRAMLWELIAHGVLVRYHPPPFVHSKLLLVDDDWALVGTANLDPRSLRLNFEFSLEVWDRGFVAQLGQHHQRCWEAAREVTLAELDGRGYPERIRDGLCKLFAPYL
jgi:cardiolipin synthase A/B